MFNLTDLEPNGGGVGEKRLSLAEQMARLNFDQIDFEEFDQARKVKADIPENFCFSMYWMAKHVGNLTFKNGFWDFAATPLLGVRLSEGEEGMENSSVPFFVDSLMPEAWTSNSGSDLDVFDPNCGDRYLSNIVIRPSHRVAPIVSDVLVATVFSFRDAQHIFHGEVDRCFIPSEEEIRKSYLNPFRRCEQYAAMVNDLNTPKMSGAQNKLPAFLTEDGVLTEARGNAFTHILKFPRAAVGKDSTMGSIEWMSLMLARGAGLPIEDFALLSIDGFGPVLAAERFDVIRCGDQKALLAEDMCSALSLRRYDKAGADMTDVMRTLLRASTSPEEDVRILMAQVIFSYYIGNDDLHLKNISLLKTCNEAMTQVESVRLSPVYDVMTIWPYNGFGEAALPINGSCEYSLDSFFQLGQVAGISESEVASMCLEIGESVQKTLPEILQSLPDIIRQHEDSTRQICDVVDWMTSPTSRMRTIIQDSESFLASARRARPGARG